MVDLEEQITKATTLRDLGVILECLFNRGYDVDRQGRLCIDFVEIAQVKGLTIEIHHREHPPPHFHVSGSDVDASFAIVSGQFLNGKIGPRHRRLVKWWHQRARMTLIDLWNQTRPSDCAVGPIAYDG